MPPRGSNSNVEESRVSRGEKNIYNEGGGGSAHSGSPMHPGYGLGSRKGNTAAKKPNGREK